MKTFIVIILLSFLVNLIMLYYGIGLIERCIVCGLIGLLGGFYIIKEG